MRPRGCVLATRYAAGFVVVVGLAALAGCRDEEEKPKPDGGMDVAGEMTCEVLQPSSSTCTVTMGSATKLLKGDVLAPSLVYRGGQVAIDEMGKITCVGCNCAAGGETTITCPGAAISPGLINPHDHITFTQNQPYTDVGERYEERHQWRLGLDGHREIPAPGTNTFDHIRWGELRFVMGGATSIVGSGGQPGFLRNLDQANNQEGLGQKAVEFEVFPLGDSGGRRRVADCDYGGGTGVFTAARIANVDSFEPHTSEGITVASRNEFLCETSATYDTAGTATSNNLLLGKTSMIHAIGLQPADYGAMAAAGTSLIWSPRSNITLYGETARVTTASRLGVTIALGTDWMPTGSMNVLRELACADSFNALYLDHHFTDEQLWKMVTINAAKVTATDDAIGALETGKFADIAIFAPRGDKPFRTVIAAQPQDVALVMRGGKVLYGDAAAVGALAQTCDTVDVCGTSKRVCVMGEAGKSYDALKTAVAALYPAFACGTPPNEPTCTPRRPVSVAGSTVYTGLPSASDSDGDGIPNATDNCPATFNPVRPVDNGAQGDADRDGQGDACDPCPLDASTTQCGTVSLSDRDKDGVANAMDNCPETPNANQANGDGDSRGDACDPCPAAADVGGMCPTSIYDIKRGRTGLNYSVRLANVLVTGKGNNGFFVQATPSDGNYDGVDFSGLFVFTGAGTQTDPGQLANATVGGRVNIEGSVAIFQGQIEIDAVTKVETVSPGPEAMPDPVAVSYADIKTGGPRAAALEGVLVTLPVGQVTAVASAFGEMTLTDVAMNSVVIDDFLLPAPPALPPVGEGFNTATGILAFRQNASKLEVRSAADLALGAPGIASFGPTLTYARVGVTQGLVTFPQPLTITLTRPAQGNTTIPLGINAPGSLIVLDVTIPDGQTTATVPVTALAQAADVTITATRGIQVTAAHVRVLGDSEAPATVALSPSSTSIRPNARQTYSVTLDIPALTATTIALAVEPSSAGTLPPSVQIPPGQISATFTYTDTSANPTATITASYLGSTSNATVAVDTGVNHLIINEVDYDQVMNPDSAEFVEIYNPSGADISLAGKALVLINGNGNTPYGSPVVVDLSPAGTLASHQYLVVAGAGVTVTAPAIKLQIATWTTDAIQNGAPDGVVLIDTGSHTVIDALSYEGAITAANLSGQGFAGTVSLVEGTALPATTADLGNGSLCRSPDGTDNDNAATDWKLCTTVSAGTANPP